MRFIDLFSDDPDNRPREARDTQKRLQRPRRREWKADGIKDGIQAAVQDALRRMDEGGDN